MYRGFKQECPEGVVQEDAFKEIYAKFFPHGNSSLYAHHVFKAFDLNSNGQISFRDLLVSLSQLLRGTAYDKLKFAFKLYDVNGDGCITKAELTDIVSSVHELMGRSSHNRHEPDDGIEVVSRAGVEDKQTREHVERLFKKLDLNGDGVVTIDEFIQSCMQDEVITESLKVFEGL
ncbi:Kv channel-interacting protein 4 isoform X4 [Panulirus ornatus]